MALYEINGQSIQAIEQTTFEENQILERQDLQGMLRDQIDTIADDVMVIAEEFGDWEGNKRRIDLLCLDRDAKLVVVELKRTETGGHMDLQAIRYAAMVSTMTFSKCVEAYRHYLQKRERPTEDAEATILDFLGWNEPREEMFAADVRIILVSADFSNELTTSILWLNERELDIECVRLRPHRHDDKVLLDVQRIIPLPEAADYTIKLKEKANIVREDRRRDENWSGHWFVNVGEGRGCHRSWDDCRMHGYLAAGGGHNWSGRIKPIRVGDMVFAYVTQYGYVGVGKVVTEATLESEFLIPKTGKNLVNSTRELKHDHERPKDSERGEYCLGIQWRKDLDRENGVCKNLAQRGTACRIHNEASIDALYGAFGLSRDEIAQASESEFSEDCAC